KFTAFKPNSQDEIAAKIGKRVIGQASNLNFSLRQVASEFLEHGSDDYIAVMDFGEEVEQKLISSKHGLVTAKGEAPAIDFLDSFNRQEWDEVRDLHAKYFAGYFSAVLMEKAISAVDKSTKYMKQVLDNQAYKAGTSTGY